VGIAQDLPGYVASKKEGETVSVPFTKPSPHFLLAQQHLQLADKTKQNTKNLIVEEYFHGSKF